MLVTGKRRDLGILKRPADGCMSIPTRSTGKYNYRNMTSAARLPDFSNAGGVFINLRGSGEDGTSQPKSLVEEGTRFPHCPAAPANTTHNINNIGAFHTGQSSQKPQATLKNSCFWLWHPFGLFKGKPWHLIFNLSIAESCES